MVVYLAINIGEKGEETLKECVFRVEETIACCFVSIFFFAFVLKNVIFFYFLFWHKRYNILN